MTTLATRPGREDNSAQPASSPQLRGPWLVAARVGWVALTLLVVALNAAMLPRYFAALQAPCAPGPHCFALQLTSYDQQLLQRWHLSLGLLAAYQTALSAVTLAFFIALGALLFWRKSADRMALAGAYMLVLFGGVTLPAVLQATLAPISPAWFALVGMLNVLGQSSFVIFFLLFPNGRFVPHWMHFAALGYVAYWLDTVFIRGSLNNADTTFLDNLIVFVSLLCVVGLQIYRYRYVSSPRERQQTKWVVLGLAIGILGFVLLITLGNALLPPALLQSQVLSTFVAQTSIFGFMLLIPLAIVIAILRSGLFDIDVIINRALVYGSLTALLAAVYFGCVIAAQALGQALTGVSGLPPVAIVASTLLIAALFTPLRRWIQAFIDRRFYRRKYDAAKTVATFSAALRNEVDLAQLNEHLVAVVRETMQPAHVSLWLREPAPTDRMLPARQDGAAQ